MLGAAVCAFAVAAFCILYQSFRELSTSGEHFTGAGAGTANGGTPVTTVTAGAKDGSADAQLQALQQILAAINAQNSADGGVRFSVHFSVHSGSVLDGQFSA